MNGNNKSFFIFHIYSYFHMYQYFIYVTVFQVGSFNSSFFGCIKISIVFCVILDRCLVKIYLYFFGNAVIASETSDTLELVYFLQKALQFAFIHHGLCLSLYFKILCSDAGQPYKCQNYLILMSVWKGNI